MTDDRLTAIDRGWRCCPPGRGCNAGGWQPCHLTAIEAHTDRDAVEAARFWWCRWRKLRPWKLRERRDAWAAFDAARERALASPLLPPPKSRFIPAP